jgi:hypothetical protein
VISLAHLKEKQGGDHGLFFTPDRQVKRAPAAVSCLLRERSLGYAMAHGAGHHPAGPACVFPFMNAVQPRFSRSGTDTEFANIPAPGLSAAFHDIPAIPLFHIRRMHEEGTPYRCRRRSRANGTQTRRLSLLFSDKSSFL